jgi:hypothetical protein
MSNLLVGAFAARSATSRKRVGRQAAPPQKPPRVPSVTPSGPPLERRPCLFVTFLAAIVGAFVAFCVWI